MSEPLVEPTNPELTPEQAETQENAFKKYLEENELDEQTFLNKYQELESITTKTKEDLEDLEAELEQLRSNSSKPEENQPIIPKDKTEFFNKFAERPTETLEEFFKAQSQQFYQHLNEEAQLNAIAYMENQKDYYDGIERDIERVIRKNASLLQNQRPMERMKYALKEIRRDKKVTKSQPLTPPVVSNPTKASAPSADPKAMTADEMKQWLISQGAGVSDY